MATNLATVETALEKARSLMPTENDMKSGDPADHSAQKVSARIREEEARKAAGLPIVLGLKQLAKAQDRNKVNHVTVAFAAAYLLHYMPRVDKTRYIQQADIAKLIVKMIGKYSRHGKDDGCVKLLAYDTAGGWLREYIAKKDKRSGSDSQKKKQRTRKGNSIIHVSRDELKGLRDMSAIASANMGICCTTYEQLDTAGLSWSPFQRGHHILGYVCAGHPLFNKYYQVAMNELCGNGPMPLTPRGSLAPSIPQAALEDPALNERIGSLRKTVRRICSADMSSDPKDMTSHISHASQQTRVLRYHSAIFFVALTEFSKQTSECLDLGDDEDTTRNIIMQNLDDITRFLDKVEKKGWLDTTTANSAYSEAYLRSRHHILAEHIQAYTRNDPSRQPDLVVDEKDGGPLSPGGADKKDKSDNLDALNNKTRAYKLHKEALQHIATSARYAHDRVIIGEQNTIFEDHMIKALAGERAARDELAAYVAVSGERKRLTVKLESAISSDEPTRFMDGNQAHYALYETHAFHPKVTARSVVEQLIKSQVATSVRSRLSLALTMPSDELYVGGLGEFKQLGNGLFNNIYPFYDMAGAAKWCQKLDEKDPPAPLFYLRPSAYLDTVEPHEDAKVRPARDMSSKYDVKEEYKEEVSYEVLAWRLRK
ncbi:hypothetical protein SNOG_11172 [Parastagonospora nodorum SN15]|uniref:Uncharacterized protein n=1 Tax=Phaeosphaeria nodorum (strain SN15 / ATCC MYA-4574 / FGSC 10173) TaxID=321614 RepID=Q0UAP2_PHANO|nr:hypothetical protein SNOG_11172 [Parastagonospora nodorum SN15]EAT81671.2 hypothetical protein SNOG_11172 [Parastagonospora nodorum SN15]